MSIARIAQSGLPGRPAAGTIARRSIPATLAALLVALVGAGAALAHAELVTSDPADGAVLDTSPTTITLTFSENLDPAKSSFRLLGPDGATLGTGAATASKAMTLEPPPLSDGAYTIKWTSASADDGDIERGQLTFTVQLAAASLPPSARPTAPTGPSPSAPASIAPTIAPPSTAPSVVAPTPAPSAAPTAPASSTSDVLLPIVIGLLIVAGVGAFVLRRSRGA